ncbi:MAG: hypothetical protein ACREBR_05790 [bacterium]
MADIMPNLELNKKRLQVHVTEMKLQLERFDLRKLEIQDELRKIEENIKATNLDIQNTQDSIAKMK